MLVTTTALVIQYTCNYESWRKRRGVFTVSEKMETNESIFGSSKLEADQLTTMQIHKGGFGVKLSDDMNLIASESTRRWNQKS